MELNVNRPMTMGQLASFFTSNPNLTPQQVDSNTFSASGRGYDYVHAQADRLGLGMDPASFFSRKLAPPVQSGFDAEAARLSGNFSADSLPGQLARRDAVVNSLMASDATQAKATQAALVRHNMSAYPLPTQDAAAPALSPVMQEAMRQQGITNPTEFLMRQRLGGLATPSVASGEAIPKPIANLAHAGVTAPYLPGTIYNLPSVQDAMLHRPALASTMFEGMTGQSLEPYHTAKLAALQRQQAAGIASLRRAHETHEVGYDKKGKLLWRQSVMNPSTGKMEATGPLGEGDPYQKSLEQYLPMMDDKLAQWQELAKNRDEPVAASALSTSVHAPVRDVPYYARAEDDRSNFIVNWGRGMAGDLGSRFSALFGGPMHDSDAAFRASALPPAGRRATASLPVLLNNPRFQEIAQRDPAHAQRIIQAIQQGKEPEDPYLTPLPAYAEGSFMP